MSRNPCTASLRFSKCECLHKLAFAHFHCKEQQPPGLGGRPEKCDTEWWLFALVPLHILPFGIRGQISSLPQSQSHGCGGPGKAPLMPQGCGDVTQITSHGWHQPQGTTVNLMTWGGVCNSPAEIKKKRQEALSLT